MHYFWWGRIHLNMLGESEIVRLSCYRQHTDDILDGNAKLTYTSMRGAVLQGRFGIIHAAKLNGHDGVLAGLRFNWVL